VVFTGIVEERGVVVDITELPDDARRLRVRGPRVASNAIPGESICVSGVCLTVVDPGDGEFSADVMRETLQRSGLGEFSVGSVVNLERAMRADGRFGGHIVAGHVDGRVTVQSREDSDHWRVVHFDLPADLAPMIAEKGSVTLDGVSLTVANVTSDGFSVSLIPTTLAETTLGELQVGDRVNVEVDVIARYVARILAAQQ